ncbi:MAG: hypothetical protein K6G57_09490 [Lachnospiraceae bacterium]|nr:hypothetical protein [Lachnospiraceae bacterium]
MINFEEELKKFHPALEVGDVEETIYKQDLTDAVDLFVEMINPNGVGAQQQGQNNVLL